MATRDADQKCKSCLDGLCEALGHADPEAGLKDYCRGLLLPLERKSVEPLAAHVDPQHVRAGHQALHHFVAKSEWSGTAVLERVRTHVAPCWAPVNGHAGPLTTSVFRRAVTPSAWHASTAAKSASRITVRWW